MKSRVCYKNVFSLAPAQGDEDCVAVMGNFDGVHCGHRFLIEEMCRTAQARGLAARIITFAPHPLAVLRENFVPEMILDEQTKMALLAGTMTGSGCTLRNATVEVVTFDKQMAQTPARDFMERVLRDEMRVRVLMLGYDSHFGRFNAEEGFEQYAAYGKELGIEVVKAPLMPCDGISPSSSAIRYLIKEGRVSEANRLLGTTFTLQGVVVHGYEEGRKMGFPTANIMPPTGLVMPKDGVYKTMARDDEGGTHPGVTNIGLRPTFNGHQRTIETHMIGYSGDMYNKSITLSFLERLRDEIRFDSAADLRRQIMDDIEKAQK